MQYLSAFVAWVRARVQTGDQGASMVEYGLLLALIALVAVGAVSFVGSQLSGMFTFITNSLPG